MHPCVQRFCKISLRYEHQQKKMFASALIEKLRPILREDEIDEVLKKMRMRLTKQHNNVKKMVMNESDEKMVHRKNVMKFLIVELKANLPHTTSIQKRHFIAQKVLNEMEKNSVTLDEAKQNVYAQYNIQVMYTIPVDLNKTNEHNMDIERDYDEYSGRIVYGWDDDGEAVYEPTFGANIEAPTFKKAGPMWRQLLDNRWEQRSWYEEDETIDDYRGY